MFGLFRKSKKIKSPVLSDLDGNPLQVGDKVMSFRYDLGECQLIEVEGTIYYQSLEKDEKVHWLKMVDASTEKQKVRKIEESE